MAHDQSLQLPVLVSHPSDLGRLIRELDALNEALLQLGLRHGGDKVKLPKTSLLLDKLAELNKLNLLQEGDRQALLSFLQAVKHDAPVLHFSFGADPSASFIEKLVAWLRQNIHPLTLMTTGLQPNLGAGCILRTPNRQFDFSLKQDFANKQDLLVGQIKAGEAQ